MSEINKLSGFQQELFTAERFFSMHLTRQELKNRLDKIEQKDKYINSLLQYTNDLETQLQEKENIIKEAREYIEDKFCFDELSLVKLLEILDKEKK